MISVILPWFSRGLIREVDQVLPFTSFWSRMATQALLSSAVTWLEHFSSEPGRLPVLVTQPAGSVGLSHSLRADCRSWSHTACGQEWASGWGPDVPSEGDGPLPRGSDRRPLRPPSVLTSRCVTARLDAYRSSSLSGT